ncbi:MAG: MarR family transcriptional regulator [Pseudomonadota bacterium]
MQETDIAVHIDRFMRGIHGGLNARAADFDTEHVGPGGGKLLMTIADIEPAPMQQVARLMARDKSQMTRAIKALENKGLVQRASDPGDARVTLLQLTRKGRRTVERIQKALGEVIGELLSPLGAEERRLLGTLMARVDPLTAEAQRCGTGSA